MKTLGTVMLTVVTIIFLLFGYTQWKEKTRVINKNISVKSEQTNQNTNDDPKESNKIELFTEIGKWPSSASDDYRTTLETGDTYRFAIVGSQALGDNDGWAEQLKQEFNKRFEGTIETEVFSFADINSTQLVTNDYIQSIKEFNPQMILLESFVLNDNSDGTINQSNDNLSTFFEQFQDATIIVQPTHPIFNASIYPRDVEKQGQFVSERGYVYLNHWPAWPDYMADEFTEYVDMDNRQSFPSQKGHDVWFGFLKEYFFK